MTRQPIQLLTLLSVLVSAGLAGHAAAPPVPEGYWKTPSGTIIEVYTCGRDDCMKIVKLSPKVAEKTDAKNPDAKLRGRKLCSLQVGSGFEKVDESRLGDGHVYDPESGRTYRGTAAASGDILKLRGYIGISLLGRTETWHRAMGVPESECR